VDVGPTQVAPLGETTGRATPEQKKCTDPGSNPVPFGRPGLSHVGSTFFWPSPRQNGGRQLKALGIWFAVSLLLLVALIVRGFADRLHTKLKAKLEARERRRVQARRELLRKSGWR